MDKRTKTLNISLLMIILAMLFLPACSYGDIYKCISDDGIVKYSDQPCGKKYEKIVSSSTIDHLIARARPYKQPFLDPDRISSDLVTYSKEIATSILPDALFQYSKVHLKDERTKYTIVLVLASEGYLAHNPNKSQIYDIKIKYQKRMNNGGYELWLKSISIDLGGRKYSPLTMEQVSNLRKIGPGQWVAR